MADTSRRSPWWLARRAGYKAYERLHPKDPWLSPRAVQFLDENLDHRASGLEWGSGRSTAWFAERLTHLTSVEHDPKWHAVVVQQVHALSNVTLRLVPAEHPPEEPTRPQYDTIPKYVSVANEFADSELGFVLVDGHYRQACVLAAIPKLRPGGLLTIDNTNWLPLADWGVPHDWHIVHQSHNVMTETTVWRAPAD